LNWGSTEFFQTFLTECSRCSAVNKAVDGVSAGAGLKSGVV